MSGPITPPLTVSDVTDGGSVTGRPITTIQVTDGTLSVSGRVATLTTGGGGGSGTVTSITAAADSGTGTAITTTGTFTYTGGTGVTTAVSGTTVTITADNNGTVTSITPAADSGSGTAITSSGTLTFTGGTRVTTSVSGTTVTIDNDAIEGTAVLSTGETGGTKFLREDGDGTSSWQAATATVPDPLLLGNGSAGAPTYSFTTDTDTGIFNVGANVLGFSGGGTKRAEISVSGMVLGSGAATGKVTTKGAYDLEITTNEGTNSGTITITQGVDGAISLVPNGDGYISFNNEYKFPIADGDANQVLTTDGVGALTFEDAGGGGGVTPLAAPLVDVDGAGMAAAITTNLLAGISTFATSTSGASGGAMTWTGGNSFYDCAMGWGFNSPFTGSITNLEVEVSVAGTTGNFRIGIYNAGTNGEPTTLIYSTGDIDSTSTGAVTGSLTSAVALTKGTLYYLAIGFDASASAASFALRSNYALAGGGGQDQIAQAGSGNIWREATDAGEVLPATWAFPSSWAFMGRTVPIVLGRAGE